MDFGTLTPVQLHMVVPLRRKTRQLNREVMPSAEEITCLSRDVLKKRYGKYIRRVTERCVGMQLMHCIAIANGEL